MEKALSPDEFKHLLERLFIHQANDTYATLHAKYTALVSAAERVRMEIDIVGAGAIDDILRQEGMETNFSDRFTELGNALAQAISESEGK